MIYKDRKRLYLDRYGYKGDRYPENISKHFVVIPAYDEGEIIETLESLLDCSTPQLNTEIIVLINYREEDSEEVIRKSFEQHNAVINWAVNNQANKLIFLFPPPVQMDEKYGGVGLARKIGLDLAIQKSEDNVILTCLDADCTVSKNYLQAIENYFRDNPDSPGSTIYFEHPLEGDNSSSIIDYELHLRYFNQVQRFTGFPWAFHTVGSSMTVSSEAYLKQGGMNRRKAGEDFYFFHKIISLGGVGDIKEAVVYPSSRKSSRVPFGTGHAMNKDEQFVTYPFELFLEIRRFLQSIEDIYEKGMIAEGNGRWFDYLGIIEADKNIKSIINRSSTFEAFERHFFHWLDAFKIMKYANTWERSSVSENSIKLLNEIGVPVENGTHEQELLKIYRDLERGLI